METALPLLAGANWGVTRSTVRVSKRRGICIVKIIIITTAAFLAMLGIAHGEEREAGGGGAPDHNPQPLAGGQPGATLGGE